MIVYKGHYIPDTKEEIAEMNERLNATNANMVYLGSMLYDLNGNKIDTGISFEEFSNLYDDDEKMNKLIKEYCDTVAKFIDIKEGGSNGSIE